MKTRKKLIILALLFIIAIGNYNRIAGVENVRAVAFLSIFALGAISSIFLREIIAAIKNR
ncbi:MAG: hypothetical protein K2P85_12915 [Flavobacteriaceae bacterium]|jgi:hypothetical protein|nr:hypothetical protein [Flavobacteriaceae bacterium]